ncbi:bifunctional ADP-dependent NAD(P)H-hydrate dehydratase/NAD(P)H-hydrate epimerase [Corynebacterium caspium]|uniref:bifunctional ADP-dependent NAD(P)H-hydrate dehydratase/NAD(P)H-hydrate epimerase n=1 Tax=Corynebacterium caspium TaxID=234828 RepID=UPI000375C15A|nr:bifunctional ADP-dependent NAD(P)H-hydrate dehydratase/NAD(P)H-hydrate epimerase [Corynebacterium caspium]WKD60033.1 Bifunctional NAD(P)H-hydrate repair enzyme Nnr [Corynebacterium caspium DSM 44850]
MITPLNQGTFPLYSTAAFRAAETALLAKDPYPDYTMQKAATAIAMLAHQTLLQLSQKACKAASAHRAAPQEVLILAGSGGNGGDGLYAGARLAQLGHKISALLISGRAQPRALAAFQAAGGKIISGPLSTDDSCYALIIDAIAGLGVQSLEILEPTAAGGKTTHPGAIRLSAALLAAVAQQQQAGSRVLAVDNPTPGVRADMTLTFNALRAVHLDPRCGEIQVADIGLEFPAPGFPPADTFFSTAWPEKPAWRLHPEPGPNDDKYSGGVVGICAGSDKYPGAGILCALGAVRATNSMVRVIDAPPQVVQVLPEVVTVPGQVQAWVVGPGRGARIQELTQLLGAPEPLLIDADAITLLAKHPHLQELLRARRAPTLLTPHAGEFRRLHPLGTDPTLAPGAVQELAAKLDCSVLLKGRRTILVHQNRTHIIDAGTSWAATPGSGDVLAGILGAFWAAGLALEYAVVVHAVAAALAAQTPAGYGPTSASRIAAAVPTAIARCAN